MESSVDGLQDLAYLGRIAASFDPFDELAIVIGGSAITGPNATGEKLRTSVAGVDLYAKWKPLANDKGWPFAALQSEFMIRDYGLSDRTLNDRGLYAQAVIGFARPWTIGFRYDYAEGEDDLFEEYDSASDPLRDVRHRVSAAFSYFPTEFSRLRLQYNFDHAEFLAGRDSHGVFLQAEISFGAHAAHQF
jgi:hypothetical protein